MRGHPLLTIITSVSSVTSSFKQIKSELWTMLLVASTEPNVSNAEIGSNALQIDSITTGAKSGKVCYDCDRCVSGG